MKTVLHSILKGRIKPYDRGAAFYRQERIEDIDDFKKRVEEALHAKDWIKDDGSVDMDNIE